MKIEYKINESINVQEFIDLLKRSTLGERRPLDDLVCMQGMIDNSSLIVSAWDQNKLVGISRCITDFHYCCYLADLAVDQAYQKLGIGKHLQIETQNQLGPKCKIILLAAPAATEYYGHIGYTQHPSCWTLERTDTVRK